MAQGLIGGATSYEAQCLKDILEDINIWMQYTKETSLQIQKGILESKESKFWEKVYFNFQMTLQSTLKCQDSYLHDFSIIVNSIQEDKVTERDVRLLRKIGERAVEFNHEYGRTYKEDSDWRDYGNPDFTVIEDLYAKGRDYFVTLQDASNASARLDDYISTLLNVINNNISQTISGNGNIVSGINHGEMTHNEINNSVFKEEIKQAITIIDSLKEYNQEQKTYIEDSLLEILKAFEGNDIEKQKSSKISFKAFMSGLGNNSEKLINVLASLTSIASFFGIPEIK